MLRSFHLILFAILAVTQSFAQLSISALSTNYTQDFNTLSTNTSSAAAWTNNSTLTGWYAQTDLTGSITTHLANNGSGTTASLASFGIAGTNPVSDRALGYVPSNAFTGASGTGKGYIGWRLKNNTGSSISTLTVTYSGEEWRVNNNAATHSLTVEYQTGTTVTTLTGTGWTSVAALTFTGPVASATTSALDGNAAANKTASITATITFAAPVAAGDEIMLRWSDLNDSGNDHYLGIDDVTISAGGGIPCTAASEPTLPASALSLTTGCSSITLSWTNGDGSARIVAARAGAAVTGTPTDQQSYTASTVFGSGSTIAANEYIVYNGSGSTVTVTGLSGNTTYYFTVFEYNGSGCPASGQNYLASAVLSGSQSTVCSYPQLTGVLINSCSGGCQEGDNEILFLNSGSYAIPVSPANIIVSYGSTNPPSTTYTDAFTANTGLVSTFNATANCGTLFYDAVTAGTIPANTVFMIMKSTACYGYDFSALCGNGPVYVLFSTDASWATGGNFTNGGTSGTLRYFRTDFSAVAGSGSIIDYSYEPFLLSSGNDGDAISFPAGGGAASSYFSSGCDPTSAVLPIELLSFTATSLHDAVKLDWITASEVNNQIFTVQRTSDGLDFEDISLIEGAGTTSELHTYTTTDHEPLKGTAYYRLKQTDLDGKYTYSPLITVNIDEASDPEVSYNAASHILTIRTSPGSVCSCMIIDAMGRSIFNGCGTGGSIQLGTETLPGGIYFMRISDDKRSFARRIIIE